MINKKHELIKGFENVLGICKKMIIYNFQNSLIKVQFWHLMSNKLCIILIREKCRIDLKVVKHSLCNLFKINK